MQKAIHTKWSYSTGRLFRSLIVWVGISLIALRASAAVFTVSNGNNAGAGSLRQAIIDANANAGVPHTITFTVSGVINITTSLPTITRQVTIDGGNAVTISGPGGNNTIALFVLGTGSGGSTIRNMTLRNTGIEPIILSVALSGITIENMVLTQTGAHYMNRGIVAHAAVSNLTIRNVIVTGLEDKLQGIYFAGNVTNVLIDGFKLSGGGGLTAQGIHVRGVTNGLTIKNSVIDLDDPATADDGDYGVYFLGAASNVTIDSSAFHDNEIYGIYCNSTATNFSIKNSTFDNLDGWTNTKFVYFKTNTSNVTIDKNVFNADLRNTVNDGNYAVVMLGAANQTVNILNNQFIENDTVGVYLGNNLLANNHDNVLIQGNTFTRNGTGNNATGAIDFLARNVSSDGGAIRITENTFADNNGNAVIIHPGNTTSYVVPNFTISKNIIYNTKSPYGAIRIQYVDKIIITDNSIYNNQGLGIQLTGAGNCSYEGVNTPQILSSVETSAGVYTVTVKMPTICGTGKCSLEIFSNEAGIKGAGGQHYVTTRTGISQGNQTLTAVTGSFAEITAAPYGSWSATLRVTDNCGTSEFSNRKAIKPNGPAGISNGIAVWLRGDDLSVNNAEPTASGQVITGWQEFSGGGGPSATTVINNPLTKLNGINFNPVADMDGDGIRGHFPGAPTWISTPTVTSVAVFNPLSITASNDRFYCLFSQAGSDFNVNTAQIEFWRNGNNIQSYRGNTALSPVIPGTTGVSAFNKPGVFSSVTSASNHTYHYNGANMGSANYSKGNFAISQWFVGTGWNTTDGWQGGSETDFAEVFTYNRVLIPDELQKVQSYMALKYGIAMKQNYVLSNGTLVWDVTANATYSKEIAALVRDNVSVLHQKQAKAFHPDEVISIALGNELAATNKDNEDSVVNNLSVFMWGNDSASVQYSTPYITTYSDARMTRVWKVQKTNWSDATIIIKLKGGNAHRTLLVSANPTFASGVTNYPLNDTGAVILNSSLLANGVYFTFANKIIAPACVTNGIQAWYRADDVNASGASWTDYSGYDRNAIQSAVANQPDFVANSTNFNPAFDFNGTADNLSVANNFSISGGSLFTSIAVINTDLTGVRHTIWGNTITNGAFHYVETNNFNTIGAGGVGSKFGAVAINAFTPKLTSVTRTAATTFQLYTNGSTDGAAGNISAFGGSFASSNMFIGNRAATASNPFNGKISEIIIYNRALNATELRSVHSYLSLKYGITLSNGTTDYIASNGATKMWDATVNAAYNKDIAGIGKDTCGDLHQKQSKSINTGALVTMAVGNAIATDNRSNTFTVTNNLSFLTWGDNGSAATYTSAVNGANVTLRMPRVWKVDKTNWADQDITIKLNASVQNTYLLISNADATFATIDQELALNADSTITLSSDLLPDGAYFTFAKQIIGPGFVNTGIQVWLRADDGVSANDTWYDYSGNDINATQATVGNQPVHTGGTANFNPAFRFDGTDDYMDFASTLTLTGTNPFTVVGLGMRETISTWDAFLSQQGTTTGGFLFGIEAANRSQIHRTGTGTTLTGTATNTLLNFPYLVTGTRSGNNFALYNNGGADGTIVSTHSYNVSNIRLGNRLTSADLAFGGKIPEVIVYNRALAAFELQKVHSYLALKYGITINQTTVTDYVATDWDGSTGTKIWTASKNGLYNKNIAGIGRDDKTALYQKQSRSASDSLITIALGSSIAADNAANGGSIDDLSFFTWADNGGAATFSVVVTSVANATNRMARVWKVDRTNWSDQDITIKATQGGDRYVLVNATDATFGVGTLEYAINTATGTATINTADLPDGAYFTLATKIVGPACVNNGIVAWLRADYAGAASSWVDFSGNQTNAVQATTANQPSVLSAGLNYNQALSFNGTTDYLQIPQASISDKFSFGNAARTLIGVGVSTTTTDQLLVSYGTFATNQASGLRKNIAPAAIFEAFGATGIIGPVGSFPTNKVTMISGRYTGTASGIGAVYTNGISPLTSTAQNWNTLVSAEGAQIGKYVGENRYWNGNIGEVIVYNRNLTDAEFQQVSSYLALKYGITLNQTTPTDYIASDATTRMWTAADNTGYNRRITGIGRDDCTELYQKQSLSVDTGHVAIAIGDELVASNVENTGTIDNNNSWFVFADNGAATQYNTQMGALQNLTTRMARVWKVDKTNWADAGVTFKLTGGTDKIYLVVSGTDEIFDGLDAAYQLDASGNVTIPTDLIPDGAYFTFAKELNGPGYVNIGVQLWLRADDNVSSPATWYDYSGNENDANQATAGNQPLAVTNSVNYNPAFDFDGTNDYMDFATNAGISGTNLFTVASVGVRGTVSTGDALIAQQGIVNNNLISYFTGGNKYAIGSTGIGSVTSTGTYATANVPYLNATTRSAGNLFSLYTNGSADGTGTPAYSFLTNNLRLGNRDVTADIAFDGNINEVVVYNRALPANELRQVNSYLALKYGITMSGDYVATDGTTTYWSAANNTGYLNNVTGIGRDDNTKLNQKQSRSVNTASNANMVAMGLGSIAATNKDNTSAFTDDLSFLVWGDNGLTGNKATEYPAVLNPGGCSNITRLQREWKLQKTGTVDDVQLQVYLAGLVPNSTGLSDLKLLIDDDGDFSNGGTSITEPAAYDGATQIARFDGISFTDGQYFTLVTDLTNQAPGGVTTNLYTWYRADKGVTTATGVSVWADQSASLKDVTQATAGSQPVYNTTSNLINFNPDLSFDGTADVLVNAAISHTAATNGEDIFAVVLPNTVAGVHNIVGMGTVANSSNTTEFRFSSNMLQYGAGAPFTAITNTGTSNGMVQLANSSRNNTGAGASLLLNGASVATGTIAPMQTLNQLNIGSRRYTAANTQFFNGQIAEVAIYNRQLNAEERQKVASYLAMKYGITLAHNYLDPAGTVVWDITTNTGYSNNITSIGRDDCNGLHQKQSKSVNANAMVTIGSGSSIEASNLANQNVLDNNSALLFGDNNADITTWVYTEAPGGRQRIAREWKTQLTGTIGTVTIQVPASTSAAAVKLPAEINKMYLLVDDDGDFSSGATHAEMVLNGDNWEVSYQFTGNVYYTFATGNNFLSLSSKVILQGAWNGTAMTTDLKTASLLPATDPYGLSTTPSVTPNATAALVVDWVQVELRDVSVPTTVVSSRAAFVLADGSVVDTNYTQPLAFHGVDAGSYMVVIRHRNHLGIMTQNTVDFSLGAATIDFTNNTTLTYGSYAQKDLGSGVMAMWAGNVNGDKSIRHAAKPSDASAVQSAVLAHPGNTSANSAYTGFINAYSPFDVNLDGKVHHMAAPSDHSIIVNNVKMHPGNVFGLTSYVITEQLP